MRTAASVSYRRPIRLVVIHCTDTPDGRDVSTAEIRRWHVSERGMADIAYHLVVLLSGRVDLGRDPARIGAHAKGFNLYSLGYVWVGRSAIADAQRASLVRITAEACTAHMIDPHDAREAYGVKGHRTELTHNGTCPGIDMDAFRDDVRAAMKKAGGWQPPA